jgi:hypothetical protein
MLAFLQATGKVSDRRARLCVAAWARSFHHHAAQLSEPAPFLSWIAGPQWLPQLEAAEGYEDGRVDRKTLRATRQKTGGPYNLYMVATGISHFSFDEAGRVIQLLRREFGVPPEAELFDLLRCVFGCLPFRSPMPLSPAILAWNGGTIPGLARATYEQRTLLNGTLDPIQLAVLADALEEGGGTDAELLLHLRSPGLHVRGCFALDTVLGKS